MTRWRPRLLGPLFYWDLVRLARRGRSTLLRCAYALTLFGVLCFAYSSHFPRRDFLADLFGASPDLSQDALAKLARDFAVALLAAQTVAVYVLTPAYVAGAIAEERERGTLPLLFTTHLTDGEIVGGKLFARLAHLAGVLLAGLPILSLLPLWGGVEPTWLLVGFAATCLSLLSTGAICVVCSVACRKVLTALLTGYAFVVFGVLVGVSSGLNFLASPVTLLDEAERALTSARPGEGLLGLLGAYAVVHGLIALTALGWAVATLRSEPPPASEHSAAPIAHKPDIPTGRLRLPVGDNGLLWKEMSHGPAGEWSATMASSAELSRIGVFVMLIASPVIAFWVIALITPLTSRDDLSAILRPFLRGAVGLLLVSWIALATFRVAGSISRERDQRTLDGLLVLPVTTTELLGTKWLGAILRYRVFGYILVGLVLFALIVGTFHPLGAGLLLLVATIHLAFAVTAGLWLSVVSRNTLWANLTAALLLLTMLFGAWLGLANVEGPMRALQEGDADPWWRHLVRVGLNPLASWDHCCFSWKDWSAGRMEGRVNLGIFLTTAAAGLSVFATLTLACGLSAWYRFRAMRDSSAGLSGPQQP